MRRVTLDAFAPSVLALVLTAAPGFGEVLFPRHPAPSPDAREIAFSWQGDIWIVPATGGQARRLTASQGYDHRPIFSPDGRSIAFTSDRHGNHDVFVLELAGGPARQLTFRSGSDVALDWTPDGSGVVFSSFRDLDDLRSPSLYAVGAGGGTAVRVLPAVTDGASIAADGTIYFTHGAGGSSASWWRRGYDGPGARDILAYTPARDSIGVVIESPHQEMMPSWSSVLGVVYTSEATGSFDVHVRTPDGETIALTRFADAGARFPRVAREGDLVAFEREDGIWTVRPGVAPGRITIQAPGDGPNAGVERLSVGGADDISVSPDGEGIAFSYRGEIFVRRADPDAPELTRITRSPARDVSPIWLPEGDGLFFVSDLTGDSNVHRVRAADGADRLVRARTFTFEAITRGGGVTDLVVSPSGDRLAFVRGHRELVVAGIDGGTEKTLLAATEIDDPTFSPDGRYLACARTDDDFNTEIVIVSTDGKDVPLNVTQHPDVERRPVFSRDGRKLAFSGRRRYQGGSDVWFVWLRKADDEKTVREILDEKPPEDDDEAGAPRVVIDAEEIHRRVRRVTTLPGDESELVIASDGRTFVFSGEADGGRDVFSVRWDGRELERLTTDDQRPRSFVWNAALSRAFFVSGAPGKAGRIRSVDLDGALERYDLSGRLTVSLSAERRQMFDEAWRVVRDGFYDPSFRGVDWEAARTRFAEIAAAASHPADFRDAVRLMLGELDASHLEIWEPRREASEKVETGELGVVVVPDRRGGVRVTEVLPESPASRASSRLSIGDVIESVDGVAIGAETNLYELLQDTVGESVRLGIRGRGELAIRPFSFSSQRRSVRERDVRWRRARTDSLSGGRVGYIALASMGSSRVDAFERALVAAASGKDALVIDVRNNTGGWITDILLHSLLGGPHATTIARGGGPGYPTVRRLVHGWWKPLVVLTNEATYSNGEIFAWATKTLGRGTIVGAATFGGVISTGGAFLADGSWIRRPFRGWYVDGPDGTRIDMEGTGCPPDVPVASPPTAYTRRRDPQLARAVEIARGR